MDEERLVDEAIEALTNLLRSGKRPTPEKEEVGKRYRNRRSALGLNRTTVAERLTGVSDWDLAAFENGWLGVEDMPEGFLEELERILMV